jgi:hypothetical protein
MEKHDVEFIGTLLNETPETVEQIVTDGQLSEKIKALKLMSQPEVETLKTNLAKEVKEKHINELVESAKAGEVDKSLYGVIKGAVVEKAERNLAKEYGVTEYDGLNDLVSKAINKNKGQADDTKIQELSQKITDLQGINTNLVKEKDTAVKQAEEKANNMVLTRDKRDLVNGVPFDFTDVDQNDLDKITGQRKQIVESVFDSRYELSFDNDNVVVKDKEGNIIKNQATLEPVSPSDVMNQIPVELGIKIKSPESGGQGGSSSSSSSSAPFKDQAEFNAYCEQHGIKPTGSAGIALWAKRRPKQ